MHCKAIRPTGAIGAALDACHMCLLLKIPTFHDMPKKIVMIEYI